MDQLAVQIRVNPRDARKGIISIGKKRIVALVENIKAIVVAAGLSLLLVLLPTVYANEVKTRRTPAACLK